MRLQESVFGKFPLVFAFALAGLMVVPAPAQQARTLRAVTAADYARAEKFLPYNTTPLVLNTVRATWLAQGDRFWYRNLGAAGSEFVLLDAASGAREPAFNHAKIAAALGAMTGQTMDAAHLPFQEIEFSPDS